MGAVPSRNYGSNNEPSRDQNAAAQSKAAEEALVAEHAAVDQIRADGNLVCVVVNAQSYWNSLNMQARGQLRQHGVLVKKAVFRHQSDDGAVVAALFYRRIERNSVDSSLSDEQRTASYALLRDLPTTQRFVWLEGEPTFNAALELTSLEDDDRALFANEADLVSSMLREAGRYDFEESLTTGV